MILFQSKAHAQSATTFGSNLSPKMQTLARPLSHMARCINLSWPCLLVGSSGTGKSACVRWLANATGNRLREFALSSSTDSTELLGCYEQIDPARRNQDLIRSVLDSLRVLTQIALSGGAEAQVGAESALLAACQSMQNLQCNIKQSMQAESKRLPASVAGHTIDVIHHTLGLLSKSQKDRVSRRLNVVSLTANLKRISSQEGQSGEEKHRSGGAFEWTDGEW